MTTTGAQAVRVAGDGWAIFSQDDSLAAHFEFTVAITAGGAQVLTPWHTDPGRPGASGVVEGLAGAR
jgi:methionyl aminopeptidase